MLIQETETPVVQIAQAARDILIVEDEEDSRESLADALRALGEAVTVHTAADPRVALEILRDRHIDLLITDYRMPGMSGISMLRAAAAIPPRGCILWTAFNISGEAEQAAKEGLIHSYVQKPGDPQVLMNKVYDMLYHW